MAEDQFTEELTDFSLAFEAAATEEPPQATAEEASPATAEEGNPPAPAAEETPPATAEEGNPPAPAAEETPSATAEEKPLSAEDVKAIAAKAAEEKAAADRAAADKAAEEKAAADKAAADRAAAEKPSKDEQALIDDMVENFPEVSKAMDVIQRITMAKLESLVDQKLGTMLAQLDQKLAPVMATTQTVANNAHEKAILDKHSDAFDIVDSVGTWVDKQPAFLQATYKDVLEKGSAGEVVQLLDLYKESTKPAETQTPVKDTTTAAEVKREKQAKLAAQEGVTIRQAPVRETLDPNDFSGAFSRFAK